MTYDNETEEIEETELHIIQTNDEAIDNLFSNLNQSTISCNLDSVIEGHKNTPYMFKH